MEGKISSKSELNDKKRSIQDLNKQYEDLLFEYVKNKNEIKDKRKLELEDLKDNYNIARLSIEKPLKAEKYRYKVEKKKRNRALNEAPRRGLLEEIGNATTHGVGAIIGAVCLVLMILKANDGWSLTAAIVYGSCFFLQMLFSCLYHSFRGGSTVKRIFRRFDYSSIYLAIGGTFAPLWLIYMRNSMWGQWWGLGFFIAQWVIIATGITFVGVFGPGRLRWLHFTLYFVVGWSALLFFPTWISKDIPLLLWELAGGITYTAGMIPFALLRKKPVAHFIWHFFVLAGAILMWVGQYLYVF